MPIKVLGKIDVEGWVWGVGLRSVFFRMLRNMWRIFSGECRFYPPGVVPHVIEEIQTSLTHKICQKIVAFQRDLYNLIAFLKAGQMLMKVLLYKDS